MGRISLAGDGITADGKPVICVTGGENIIAAAAAMARRAGPNAGQTRVIAIDGRSGSGKTSLAAELRDAIGAPVVTLEDLYGGWDGLERGIDLLLSEVLKPLRAGRAARVPRYDWIARAWAAPWVLEPPGTLILEGVGAGARRVAGYASVLVWMEATESVRKKRALDRDGETFALYWGSWAAQEDAMLAREHTPDRADLIIDAADAGQRRLRSPDGQSPLTPRP
jgi:uridine kinase